MNVFKILLLASAMALPFAISAKAADMDPETPVAADPAMTGFYLRGDFGWSFLNWDGGDDDNAYVAGAGIGYQFTDMFRADITGSWTGEYDTGADDMSTAAVMANAYFDFANSTMLTPYVGVGAGYGWVNGSGAIEDDSGLALGGMLGVSADITENLALDVGYQIRSIMVGGDDPLEHQVTTGLRFSF